MANRWLTRQLQNWGVLSEGSDEEARRAAEATRRRVEEIQARGIEVTDVAEHLREMKTRNGFAELLAESMTNKRRRRHR